MAARWVPASEEKVLAVELDDQEYLVEYRLTAGYRGDPSPYERPEVEILSIEPALPPDPEKEEFVLQMVLDHVEREGY